MEYRKLRGVHFIRVRGSSEERFRAHVALLKNEILNGPVASLARKNEWLIRRGHGLVQVPTIADAVVWAYRHILLPILDRSVGDVERRTIQRGAEAVGISYEVCRETLFQPDVMLILARLSLSQHSLSEWFPRGVPGCTSAVALKEWTEGRKLLVCRNLDYPAVGSWEKSATVVFNEPSEKGEIPYVSLTAAGVAYSGVTSINSAGITLSAHAHFGKEISLSGTPIVLLGDEIIRTAQSLGQAVDIARKRNTIANWSFVLSSGKENQALVIEMTPSRVEVREAQEGYLSHTNYFHHPELRKSETLFSGGYCEDLVGRFCRIRQLLEPHRGALEPRHMAAALGDHIDFHSNQERIVGNTISVVSTVTSAVFEPESQKFWIAARNESPVSLGEYLEIDIQQFWKKTAEEYEGALQCLPPAQPKNPRLLEGIRFFREAYLAYQVHHYEPGYQEKALAALRQAIDIYPSDGHVWLEAGVLALKLHLVEEAKQFFEGSRKWILSAHLAAVRDLYLARCLDLMNQRAEALILYRKNLKIQEPKLHKAILKGIKRPYRLRETKKIVIDLQFPDSFQY